jgi:hypothetical protein
MNSHFQISIQRGGQTVSASRLPWDSLRKVCAALNPCKTKSLIQHWLRFASFPACFSHTSRPCLARGRRSAQNLHKSAQAHATLLPAAPPSIQAKQITYPTLASFRTITGLLSASWRCLARGGHSTQSLHKSAQAHATLIFAAPPSIQTKQIVYTKLASFRIVTGLLFAPRPARLIVSMFVHKFAQIRTIESSKTATPEAISILHERSRFTKSQFRRCP